MYKEESSASFMTYLGVRNSLRSSRNGLAEKQCNFCRCLIHWERIFCFLHGMLKTFKEESPASSLAILQVYLVHWGRIFHFLTRNCLIMLGSIGEESSTPFMGMMFQICLIHQEIIFCFVTGIVFLSLCDLLEMVLGCTYFIGGRYFCYFFSFFEIFIFYFLFFTVHD